MVVGPNLPPSGCISWPGDTVRTIVDELVAPAELSATIVRVADEFLAQFVILLEPVIPNVLALEYQPVVRGRVTNAGAHSHRARIKLRRRRVRNSVVAETEVLADDSLAEPHPKGPLVTRQILD